MFEITREVSFSYGHRLLGHEGKCARLHGHNGRLRVALAAERLGPTGMVVDFGAVKGIVRDWLAETLDHRLVLRERDPAVAALRAIGEPIYVVDFDPTAENLARHIYEGLLRLGLPVVAVSLDETEECAATYRPG
ncbi:MAG: 6-carboxytetrahydropterin synthase [Candidatus Eisenbacteria bacterium]|nr:6-carboxytetrahydropterin synthase [Candidatus Eisenbacteria bacterium]